SGDILVGRKGVATFTQSGGTIDASSMVAGNMAGGDGTINISGGSNVVSGTITLGRVIGSKGTLLMSGGSMTAAALKVGSGDGANGSEGVFTLSGKDTYLKADTLSLGDAGMDVASTLRIEDGEFQIQSIVADGNSANESFFLEGGVLKLRHVSSPNIVNDIDALITAGVFTWTNASPDSLAATHSPSTATRTWTNAAGVKLYADESGTNYSYIWAATPPEKSLKLFMISSSN
ncbi:MAG: hypothetical protein JEZ10_09655, partial [Verrucomicrobia bacterium]|nr:hypothetical protein [Verrucomicrobiota bacterium]